MLCSIAEDTLAIVSWAWELHSGYVQLYKFNQQVEGVITIQDHIPTGDVTALHLSTDYIAYWDTDEQADVFVYSREKNNQTFTFHQQLNFSGPDHNHGLALDNDILVVGGHGRTHIFSEQIDGQCEETVTLDKVYSGYFLSGRNLIVTSYDNGVYYFDIEDCSQAIPTQTPSLSTAPTDTPSSFPSMHPSFIPTLAPSSSSPPSMSPSSTLALSSS